MVISSEVGPEGTGQLPKLCTPASRLHHAPFELTQATTPRFPPLRAGHDHGGINVLSCERAHAAAGLREKPTAKNNQEENKKKIGCKNLLSLVEVEYLFAETGV